MSRNHLFNIYTPSLQEDYEGRRFTSARLKSKASRPYGRLQIRAKIPNGRDLWPALWLVSLNSSY